MSNEYLDWLQEEKVENIDLLVSKMRAIDAKLGLILACLKTRKTKAQVRKERNEGYSVEFEGLWAVYPRKVGKHKAHKAYLSTMRRGASHDDILAAVKNYAETCRLEGRETRFICHMATFLGPDETWRDYIEKPLSERKYGGSTGSDKNTINMTKKAIFRGDLFGDATFDRDTLETMSTNQLWHRLKKWLTAFEAEGHGAIGMRYDVKAEVDEAIVMLRGRGLDVDYKADYPVAYKRLRSAGIL